MNEQLLATLSQLVADLRREDEKNPHRKPFQMRAGSKERDRVLNIGAAPFWEEIAQADPNDPWALHHLAILYHGNGLRGHLGGASNDPETLELWRQGLRH